MKTTSHAPVSVVIPCCNCAQTLARAVASVAAQTWLPHELILVDDASLDDTRRIMRQLQQTYAAGWIHLIFLDDNRGAASARNAGWSQASQALLAFLDADDAWHPEKIQRQCTLMQAQPQLSLSGHGWRVARPGDASSWPTHHHPARRLSKWRVLISNPIVTPSVMLRTDLSQRFREHQRHAEDHMLWMDLVCAGYALARFDDELTALYKPFGAAGLSSNMWRMTRSDWGNYQRLLRQDRLKWFEYAALLALWTLKLPLRAWRMARKPKVLAL